MAWARFERRRHARRIWLRHKRDFIFDQAGVAVGASNLECEAALNLGDTSDLSEQHSMEECSFEDRLQGKRVGTGSTPHKMRVSPVEAQDWRRPLERKWNRGSCLIYHKRRNHCGKR